MYQGERNMFGSGRSDHHKDINAAMTLMNNAARWMPSRAATSLTVRGLHEWNHSQRMFSKLHLAHKHCDFCARGNAFHLPPLGYCCDSSLEAIDKAGPFYFHTLMQCFICLPFMVKSGSVGESRKWGWSMHTLILPYYIILWLLCIHKY